MTEWHGPSKCLGCSRATSVPFQPGCVLPPWRVGKKMKQESRVSHWQGKSICPGPTGSQGTMGQCSFSVQITSSQPVSFPLPLLLVRALQTPTDSCEKLCSLGPIPPNLSCSLPTNSSSSWSEHAPCAQAAMTLGEGRAPSIPLSPSTLHLLRYLKSQR